MNNNQSTEETYTGTCIWFGSKDKSKGKKTFGFIKWDGHPDLFVHFSDISAEGYRSLQEGQKVSFQIGKNHNGQPKAINVCIIE